MLKASELNRLGISIDDIRMCKTIKELWESPPKFVCVQVVTDAKLFVDGFPLRLKKGEIIIMPLDIYRRSKRSEKRTYVLKPFRKTFAEMFSRYKGQNLDNKTLLISRTGGIGDILFSQPLIKYIKEKWPTCRIIFATAPRYQSLFNAFPKGLIDNVIPVPYSKDVLDRTDFQIFFEGAIERTLQSRHVHAVDLFAKMANLPNIDFRNEKYKISLIPDKILTEQMKKEVPDNYVVLQLRATSPVRMMSTPRWCEIIHRMLKVSDVNFAFVDTPERESIYEQVIEEIMKTGKNVDRSRFYNLCSLSKGLLHAVSIINLSRGVVGIDSSLNHIAGALKKPILGLFSPFKAELRLKYYDKVDWVQPNESKCARWPCFSHGNEAAICEYISNGVPPTCMDELDTNEIIEKFVEMLQY